MDPVMLSRWQFAITTVYHFFFVPLTLGLAWFVAILETTYVISGKEIYKKLTKFWGKLFLINFAMGVVTGIVMEFQFGMNWADYSRFVGDVFGAPLAIETLTAFFLESTFLGIWIFGWDRLPKALHAGAFWMVVLGSSLSALWILLANGFMQHPVGYEIVGGRAVLADFGALMSNPRGWYFFWHTIAAGLATGAFFMLGISAYHLFRKREVEAFRTSFYLAAIVGLISSVAVGLVGHAQGVYLREVQPMAAAASEALWETADPAPFTVVAIFDSTGKKEVWGIHVPYLLSMLYYNVPSGKVDGINNIQAEYEALYGPGDYIPVVALPFWTFRIMVGLGLVMIAVASFAVYMRYKKWPEKLHRWLKWGPLMIALPYLANTAGWILTETGRQPWIVHGLLRTEHGGSPSLTGGMVLISLIGFALIYALLMGVDVYLLAKYARAGISSGGEGAASPEPSDEYDFTGAGK